MRRASTLVCAFARIVHRVRTRSGPSSALARHRCQRSGTYPRRRAFFLVCGECHNSLSPAELAQLLQTERMRMIVERRLHDCPADTSRSRQQSEFAIPANRIAVTERGFRHQRAVKSEIARVFVRHHLRKSQIMLTDRIEFISEYCDRWCERCAFTTRCSAYAVQAALGMCGDLAEALHLAVGAPMSIGAASRPVTRIEVAQPTPQEVRELEAVVEAHAKRIKEAPLTKQCHRGRGSRASMVP